MIKYECSKNGCRFDIDEEDVIRAEVNDKYIVCPLCGTRNIRKKVSIEKLMQQRSAVNI